MQSLKIEFSFVAFNLNRCRMHVYRMSFSDVTKFQNAGLPLVKRIKRNFVRK